MTTKVNTPNLNTTFLGTLVKINDTQTVNNKTFNSATLVAPALGTPVSGDFSTGSFTWPLFYQDIKANAAFVAANSAGVYANAAFVAANTGSTNALSAGVYANAAYVQANTANTNAATTDQRAVTSGVFANGAYLAANTADQRAVTSGVYANTAYSHGNAAYTQANTATTNAATADQRAVTSGVYANSAFSAANAAVSLTGTQTLTNKSLSDNTTYFIDEGDATKRMQLQLSSISTGATRILTVPDFDGIIATLYGTENFLNKTLSSPTITTGTIRSPIEPVTVSASAPTATLNYYIQSGAVSYFTANSTNNFTWNIAAANDVSLNTWLSTGHSVTIALLITNGSTAYYPNAFSIDGTSVTPKYVGGNAFTSGNANAIDFYNMTIIKTASATYTVFISQTKLA